MMLNILRLLFFIMLWLHTDRALSQTPVQSTPVTELPRSIVYKNKFDTAVTWRDSSGEHYVVRSKSDADINEKWGRRTAQLFAYHYLLSTDSTILIWKMQDGIIDCEVDFHASFIPGSFSVTDLDKNTIPEIWLMYSQSCRGDISAAELKIIMYEGAIKHAMRGRMISQLSADEPGAGKYTFDNAFKKAKPVIKRYAMNLWEKNKEERWWVKYCFDDEPVIIL